MLVIIYHPYALYTFICKVMHKNMHFALNNHDFKNRFGKTVLVHK